MSKLDLLIVLAVALAASGGFRRGLVTGFLALLGFAAGALLGFELGEALAGGTSASALSALVGGFVASGLLAGVGTRLRSRWGGGVSPIRDPSRPRAGLRILDALDRALGAVLSMILALVATWLAAAIAVQPAVPAAVREAIDDSRILERLDAALPAPDPIVAALERFNPLPRLPGPSADVSAPPAGIARDPDVRAARASVVRVLGAACGRATSGSGWVAARGLVVTNAHVIAGQRESQVQVSGEGRLLDAYPAAVDERNDIAVLRVRELDAPVLRMAAEVERNTAVAMLGFPAGGPFQARPARVGATLTSWGGQGPAGGPAPRSITSFRARVRPGNSGGPLVDRSGRVAATVFAARAERRSRTGFAVPNGPVRRILARARGRARPGPCA